MANPTELGYRTCVVAKIFITGGTGYIGLRLIPELLKRGHQVKALVRQGSECKLSVGAKLVIGDALDVRTFQSEVVGCDTFIQLVGVAHPSPAKARQFVEVDLASATASIQAAAANRVSHFVYVSVAQPAPMMKAYIEVRHTVEEMIREHRLVATVLRPWYVLGPGHRWPYLLLPMYWLAELFPPARAGAQRLGLVTIDDMVATLLDAVEFPAEGMLIVEVPQIRKRKTRPAASVQKMSAV